MTPRIKLERVLPFEVLTNWRPEIHGKKIGWGPLAGWSFQLETSSLSRTLKPTNPDNLLLQTNRRFLPLTDWNNERYGVKRNETGMADLTIRWAALREHKTPRKQKLCPLLHTAANHHRNRPTNCNQPRPTATNRPRFPDTAAYAGENMEAGYNGLYMYHTAHSWVSGLRWLWGLSRLSAIDDRRSRHQWAVIAQCLLSAPNLFSCPNPNIRSRTWPLRTQTSES